MVLTRDLIEVPDVVTGLPVRVCHHGGQSPQSVGISLFVVRSTTYTFVSNVPSEITSAFRLEEMASSQGHVAVHRYIVQDWIWK
jgi:hypothetical protein